MTDFNRQFELAHVKGQSRPRTMPGKSIVGTPQFPGMQTGDSIADVRTTIKKQKRVKGYNVTVDTGTTTTVDLQLSGTARIFLGFAILLDPTQPIGTEPDQVSLTINNEIVIAETNPEFFSPDFCDDEYYFIPRPLSGQDDIAMEFTNSNAAQKVRVAVYYL